MFINNTQSTQVECLFSAFFITKCCGITGRTAKASCTRRWKLFEQLIRNNTCGWPFLAATGKSSVLETIKMTYCTTQAPTWGSMVLDADFSNLH